MSLRKSTRDPSVDRQLINTKSLGLWAQKGVTVEKLQSLDPDRLRKVVENVPDITRLLKNDFPADRLNELHPSIHPAVYAEAWQHNIDPSDINKAHFTGYYQDADAAGSKMPSAQKEVRRLREPKISLTDGRTVHGNLPHYVSARIGGATHDEVMDAARALHSWGKPREVEVSGDSNAPTETHGFIPLSHYAKHINAGGTHEEFKELINDIKFKQDKCNTLHDNKVTSANNIMARYNRYRENGADHYDALNAVDKFNEPWKDGLPSVGREDRHFIKTLQHGGTPKEYWNAVNNKYDPEQYSKLRETMGHNSALSRMKPQQEEFDPFRDLL